MSSDLAELNKVLEDLTGGLIDSSSGGGAPAPPATDAPQPPRPTPTPPPPRILRVPSDALPSYRVRVQFLDAVSREYTVTEDFSVSDLVAHVAESVGLLEHADEFHIVEGIRTASTPASPTSERWLRLASTLAEAGIVPSRPPSAPPLVFRMRWFKIPVKCDTPAIIHQVFLHAVRSFVVEDPPMEKRKAMQLAGIQLQAMYGDRDPEKHVPGLVSKSAAGVFVGASVLAEYPADLIEAKAFETHSQMRGKDNVTAEREYLNVAMANDCPMFGATMFTVTGSKGATRRLAVLWDGIFVLIGKEEGSQFHSFRDITDITVEGTDMVLITVQRPPLPGSAPSAPRPRETMKFQTTEARLLVDLACGYFHLCNGMISVPESLQVPADLPSRDRFAPHIVRDEIVPYATLLDFFKDNVQKAFEEDAKRLQLPQRLVAAMDAACEGAPDAVLDTLDLVQSDIDEKALGALAKTMDRTARLSGKAGVASNVAITTLNLSGNRVIETPACLNSLRVIVTSATPLKKLHLQRVDLNAKVSVQLGEVLRQSQTLEEINISNNVGLSNQGVLDIFKAIEKTLRKLTTFACANTGMTEKAMPFLVESLKIHPTLTSLTLAANRIGESGAKALAEVIKLSTPLAELDVTDCDIGKGGARAIADALGENTTMRRLRASDNRTGEAMPRRIAQLMMTGKCFLDTLDVSTNSIGKEGAIELLTAAKSPKSFLTTLVIGGNTIPKTAADKAIADLAGSQLTKLGLRACGLSKTALFAVCDVVRQSKTLMTLDISGNEIHPDVLPKLADAISQTAVLAELDLSHCGLGGKEFHRFVSAIKRNRSLARLALDFNRFARQSLPCLAEILGAAGTIVDLSLCEIEATESDICDLLHAIPATTKLARIDLRRNRVQASHLAPHMAHLAKKVFILIA